MTPLEKTKIYTLLKTADSFFYGYNSPDFPNEDIDFSKKDNILHSNKQEESFKPSLKSESMIEKNQKKTFSIENLNEKIILCNNCSQNISGSGKSLITLKEGTKIKVLAVTEKPLLPQEKTLLEKMLSAIQLTNLENCYITSLLKCIPVFSPSFSEFEGCMRFFETELHAIKPSFILSLGNFTSSLIIRSPKNSNFQGKFIDLNGTPLLTTFSPSEILKNSSLKRPAWEDLKVLKSKIEAL